MPGSISEWCLAPFPLALALPFEIFDALEAKLEEGAVFPKVLVCVGPVLCVTHINVGYQPFRHELDLAAKVFD